MFTVTPRRSPCGYGSRSLGAPPQPLRPPPRPRASPWPRRPSRPSRRPFFRPPGAPGRPAPDHRRVPGPFSHGASSAASTKLMTSRIVCQPIPRSPPPRPRGASVRFAPGGICVRSRRRSPTPRSVGHTPRQRPRRWALRIPTTRRTQPEPPIQKAARGPRTAARTSRAARAAGGTRRSASRRASTRPPSFRET